MLHYWLIFALNVTKRKQIKIFSCVNNNQRGQKFHKKYRAYCLELQEDCIVWNPIKLQNIGKLHNRKENPDSRDYFGKGHLSSTRRCQETRYYFVETVWVKYENTERRSLGLTGDKLFLLLLHQARNQQLEKSCSSLRDGAQGCIFQKRIIHNPFQQRSK